MIYDVIIIGAGPAGLTAALYTARRSLKTLVLSKTLGGQAILPACVENFPGFIKTDGITLVNTWKEQAITAGAKIRYELVNSIQSNNQEFKITTDANNIYSAKAVVLALGRTPKKLNVPGEDKFTGKGVAYCATCDAPLFMGKDVAVVGGGNAALDAALLLSGIANKVYLLNRSGACRAEAALLKKLKISTIELQLNTVIEAIKGENFVESIIIKNVNTNSSKEVPVQGIFIEIGGDVNSDLVKELVKLNDRQEIVIDKFNRTSVPGIFAAGDATEVPFKQMIVAAGEGTKAALSAYHYIQGIDIETIC